MSDPARRVPLIAGNWKMNKTGPEARAYCERLRGILQEGFDPATSVWVCPPFTSLEIVAVALAASGIGVAAQAVHEAASGAHTGEVSAAMIAATGARGVIVGHSERRAAGETDAQVAVRVRAALDGGLAVVACVGESLEQREAGDTFPWLTGQVTALLERVRPEEVTSLAIAYEPIWAIGTGRTATPAQAQDACRHVRSVAAGSVDPLQVRVLYGGSVTPENASELLSQPDVDGALVGGASLDPEGFARIVGAA